MILDEYASEIFESNINMMVPWYLMASFAYYKQDDPILSDSFFDNMAKAMLENWDSIEHWNKEYIKPDDLKAGSFLGEYPSRVEGGLESLKIVAEATGYGRKIRKKSKKVKKRG